MKFGLDKCQTLNIRRGKVEIEGDQDKVIYIYKTEPTNETDTYRQLDTPQSTEILHTKVVKQSTTAGTQRLQKILKTHFNSKTLTKTINTYVVTYLTYSYGLML